jgi:hypothetical protein
MQLDMFADADNTARAAQAAELQAWQAQFERVALITPHTAADGRPAGAIRHGWRCPTCGGAEPTGYALLINHGWDVDVPGRRPHPAARRLCPAKPGHGMREVAAA